MDKNGRKFVHTINAVTGWATESDLLGATVIASLDCADVDGYATAFMAMGLEKTRSFLIEHPELKVYLIFSNKDGELESFMTKALEKVLKMNISFTTIRQHYKGVLQYPGTTVP